MSTAQSTTLAEPTRSGMETHASVPMVSTKWATNAFHAQAEQYGVDRAVSHQESCHLTAAKTSNGFSMAASVYQDSTLFQVADVPEPAQCADRY